MQEHLVIINWTSKQMLQSTLLEDQWWKGRNMEGNLAANVFVSQVGDISNYSTNVDKKEDSIMLCL